MNHRRGLAGVLANAVAFRVRLRTRFRGLEFRDGVVLLGPGGAGEFSPFADYDQRADALWLGSALEAAYGEWPAAVRNFVPVNAIVPAVGPDAAAELTRRAIREAGCRTIKVKVASPEEGSAADEARVAAVRGVLDDDLGAGVGRIRVDANGCWDVDTAIERIRVLAEYGLEYVEQPCRTAGELSWLRGRLDVPVAADELVRRDGMVTDLARFADIAILKAPALGGVARTLRIAETVGVPVVISGAMDTSIGLACGVAAAAALPDLAHDCGLGTGELLADDLVVNTTLPRNGGLRVERPTVEDEVLAEARALLLAQAGEQAEVAWLERMIAAWPLVEPGIAKLVGEAL
ncbi:MAG: o-succinylbenzoate synthase [Candidatus Nanopelagicales bacterium]|nr:o-succinylbenzoate synthase [Candidatus Nanopelagicales bacterium]